MEGASSAYTRRRTAGQDDGRGRDGSHLVGRDVAGHDFGVHVQIAHATGDELPVLGTEIDDDDFLFRGSGLGHNASLGREMFEGDFTPPRALRYFYEVKYRESAEWAVGRLGQTKVCPYGRTSEMAGCSAG